MAACKYSIKRATLAEWTAWLASFPEVGGKALLDHHREKIAQDKGAFGPCIGPTDVIYHCGCLNTEDRDALPGVVIAEGMPRERHAALPDEATKRRVYGAVVYNDGSGTFRDDCIASAGGALASMEPVRGRSTRPQDRTAAEAVLDAARRRWQDEFDPTERMVVPMDEVQSQDVVEVDAVIRVRFAGEG